MKTQVLLILTTLLCTAVASVQSAHAAIITVTNTNDSGPGSLRDALAVAQDGDTIDATGISGTILLTSGELQINHNVTINGPGAANLAINGNATFPVFENFALNVTISSLTISNGAGGILNHGGLTVSDSSIVNNLVFFGDGGGIGSDGKTLTVTNSVINGNSARSGGGGIFIGGGTLTVTNSVISGNNAYDPKLGVGFGGGIEFDSGATLTVTNSTISGNSATYGEGGGIRNYIGMATVTNSTISGNSSSVGGGIGLNAGSLTVTNSTISGNSVGGPEYSQGGGIWNGANLTVTNSTFSGNSAPTGGGGGIFIDAGGTAGIGDTILNAGASGGTIFTNNGSTVTSLGYNLASDDGGGVLTGPGDQINTDPVLGPLQDNGGPTFTHALSPGSPAINAGNPNFTPPPDYDQRGPGFLRVINGRIDKGSFEVQQTPTPTPTATATPTPRPTPTPRSVPTPRLRPTPHPRPTH